MGTTLHGFDTKRCSNLPKNQSLAEAKRLDSRWHEFC